MPALWERQPKETAKAFAAFCVYRDMPASQRSLRRASQILGKSDTVIERWSVRYSWVDRVLAWEEEQDRVKRLALKEEMIEVGKRQAQQAQAQLQALLLPSLKFLARLQAAARSPDPDARDPLAHWPLDVLLKYSMRAASITPRIMEVEREALGLPRKIALTDPSGQDAAPVTRIEREELGIDQLAEIARILAELGFIQGGSAKDADSSDDEIHQAQTDS